MSRLKFVERYVTLKWKKKVNVIITIITEYAWIYLNMSKQTGFWIYSSGPKYTKTLNMAHLWIWQGSQYVSNTHYEHARISLEQVLNMSRVWIWHGSEYVSTHYTGF